MNNFLFFYSEIENFIVVPKRSLVFHKEMWNYSWTLKRLLFFTTKYEMYPDGQSLFLPQNTKWKIAPKRKFVLCLRNKNFSKLFPNGYSLFENKLKNLKCIKVAIFFIYIFLPRNTHKLIHLSVKFFSKIKKKKQTTTVGSFILSQNVFKKIKKKNLFCSS